MNTNREGRSAGLGARIVAAVGLGIAGVAAANAAPADSKLPEELPALAPRAIAWAEQQSAVVARTGTALTAAQQQLARSVGVQHPEQVRLAIVDRFPLPQEAEVRAAAMRIGLARPTIAGLTLGHSVMVRRGFENDARLLSHEFRHVSQYEARGGIAPFLGQHLKDLARFGYENSPFERDARAHEVDNHL